jgi:uncharacterized RDD family membrane protein YckC
VSAEPSTSSSGPTTAAHSEWSIPKEARSFQGHRAGVVSRTIAATIDLAVVVAILVSFYVAWAAVKFLHNPHNFSLPAPSYAAILLVGFWVSVLYLTVVWTATGRSYGNHLMGLRVLNFQGRKPFVPGAFLRALFCVFFPIGLFWVAISRANRSVQDVVLRTSVIYDWRTWQGDAAGDVSEE